MAFESLPLPPGWQVVHLDLIESIYILHKWKAHGGLPTWFWSATELGETHSSEYARCQQGIRYTAKTGGRGKREHLLILLLALIWFSLSSVTPSHLHVFLSVWQTVVFYSCVILYHKGESSNTHSCTVSVSANVDLRALIYCTTERRRVKLWNLEDFKVQCDIWVGSFLIWC